jgi:hypothetical protein
MAFLQYDIDKAIKSTAMKLSKFSYELDIVENYKNSAKSLYELVCEFLCIASKYRFNPPAYGSNNLSAHLSLDCKFLAKNSNESQRKIIQSLVQSVIEQYGEMRKKVIFSRKNFSPYLKLLKDPNNNLGKIILALSEAFEVDPELE